MSIRLFAKIAATRALVVTALALSALPAWAAMQSRPVEWKVGKQAFSGVLVYDDARSGKRPGLVMVPDWKGVTDNAVAKARHVAGSDYVILVADVYGKGVRPRNDAEAMAQVKQLYGNRTQLRARINQALLVLKQQARRAPVDLTRLGAFGYCFGGATVLELARSGADIAGVVTFHGGLDTSMPAKKGAVKASVLVLNGADDEGQTPNIPGFEKEMNDADADWQFVNFSGAVHCFALPEANKPGCRYNPLVTQRAERIMRGFFDERFGVVAR